MSIKPSQTAINPADFAQLPTTAQLDILRSLDARQKTALLLDAENGAELMAALSPQEVYLLAVERGPEHLPELLSLATPEQWSGFIDLDCWTGDRFEADKTHRWLVTLLQAEEETVFTTLKEMNYEQLILIFRAELEILSGPEADENSDARIDAVKRDGGYEIVYRNDNSARLFGKLLDVLQSYEPEFFVYLLESVRAETFGLIEESVYQQRTGRLQDMGIPEPFEARRVYAWLDPEGFLKERPGKLAPGSCGTCAPGFTLTLVRPKGLLAEVLAEGLDEALAWELAHLVNKVIMADRVELGNLEEVARVIAKVDACLNLALQWLAGEEVAAARRYLAECYSEELFRLGYSLTLRLQRRSALLGRTTVAPYLDQNARACLSALNRQPPHFFAGVTEPSRGDERLFASLAEVRAVEHWLGRMELQQRLFEGALHFVLPAPAELDLSGCQPERADDLTLVEFFLTALANRLLGRDFLPLPIAEEELAGLHGMVSQAGQLHPRLREETVGWLEGLLPGGGQFAAYCLDIWEEEFCSVGFEEIDVRFVGGLIVRLAVAT